MLDLPRVEAPQGEPRALGLDLLIGSDKLVHVIALVSIRSRLEGLDDKVPGRGLSDKDRLGSAVGVGDGAPGGRFEKGLVGFDNKLHGQDGFGAGREEELEETQSKEASTTFLWAIALLRMSHRTVLFLNEPLHRFVVIERLVSTQIFE
jgi:hypothetical protein